MGAGRRMSRKQGPPEPLSEAHFARLKRKAGLPPDRPAEAPKKRRKTAKGAEGNKGASKTAKGAEGDKGATKMAKGAEGNKGATKTAKGAEGNKGASKSVEKQQAKGGKSTKANIPSPKVNGSKSTKAKAPSPKANVKSKGKKPAALDLGDSSDEEELDEFDLENVSSSGEDEEEDDDDDEKENEGVKGALGSEFIDSGFMSPDSDEEDSSVFDSGDEHDQGQHIFSEDEDESDAEAKLTAANIEGLSRKLDRQLAEQAAANAAELAESALQTNIAGEKPQVLEDEDDDGLATKSNALLAPDLQLLRTRMTENIRVLDDFAKLAEEGRSRSEYTAQLIKDICAYYGYSEYLAEKLYNLFSPREAFAFFEANETARPVVIRTNTLRTHRRDLAQALINRGVTLEPVGKWSKVGLQVFESSVPLGATPEYLAGHYILQAASSFLPCMALEPQEGERVLDMAAAPGGKTTYMAAMMKNTGVIVANDPNRARSKGLIGNIHRLGASNVIVSNYDAREFPRPMGGFDRVLLDAPCSGTGVIAKDASVKTNKTATDFLQLPHTQKQLLLAAIDSANHASRTGGYVVYSTCSVTVEENEQVVQYALSRRPNVRLVDTGLAFGREGFTSFMGKRFDANLRLTRRYYPHAYNVDGFFVAKFKKIGPTPPAKAGAAAGDSENGSGAAVVDRTPIAAAADDDDDGAVKAPGDDDAFGGWDDAEDREYMERGRRNAMRRRGLDPRSNSKKAAAKKQAE